MYFFQKWGNLSRTVSGRQHPTMRRNIMRRFPAFRLCAAVLLSLCCAPLVHAGTYPDHPIKMLTMTKPGAQIDLLTRAVAEKLKASLGQPVLVSNVPGGSHGSVIGHRAGVIPGGRLHAWRFRDRGVHLFPPLRPHQVRARGFSVPHPARAEPERDHLPSRSPLEDAEGGLHLGQEGRQGPHVYVPGLG